MGKLLYSYFNKTTGFSPLAHAWTNLGTLLIFSCPHFPAFFHYWGLNYDNYWIWLVFVHFNCVETLVWNYVSFFFFFWGGDRNKIGNMIVFFSAFVRSNSFVYNIIVYASKHFLQQIKFFTTILCFFFPIVVHFCDSLLCCSAFAALGKAPTFLLFFSSMWLHNLSRASHWSWPSGQFRRREKRWKT